MSDHVDRSIDGPGEVHQDHPRLVPYFLAFSFPDFRSRTPGPPLFSSMQQRKNQYLQTTVIATRNWVRSAKCENLYTLRFLDLPAAQPRGIRIDRASQAPATPVEWLRRCVRALERAMSQRVFPFRKGWRFAQCNRIQEPTWRADVKSCGLQRSECRHPFDEGNLGPPHPCEVDLGAGDITGMFENNWVRGHRPSCRCTSAQVTCFCPTLIGDSVGMPSPLCSRQIIF
jgi:hypothetical protein